MAGHDALIPSMPTSLEQVRLGSSALACETSGIPKSLEEVLDSDSADVHVLAVDDNVIDRRFVERLLKASAFKVSAVDSGRRALEYLGLGETLSPMSLRVRPDSHMLLSNGDVPKQVFSSSQQVNLIITDYCMPGMTGFDLLKTIKGTSALKEIPVVIMSSENEPNRISSCLAEGAKDFLLKPVQLADLKRLRVHLRQTGSDAGT